jgi:hypothetical protein
MSLHQNNNLLLVHHKRCFCFTLATCIWDWYASDNKLPGTGRGSSKKPKAGNSPTCRLMLSPCPDPAMALRSGFQKGIFVAWQGNCMVCVNQTRPHCVNQMGKTESKALAERHGMCESALIRWTANSMPFIDEPVPLYLKVNNDPFLKRASIGIF